MNSQDSSQLWVVTAIGERANAGGRRFAAGSGFGGFIDTDALKTAMATFVNNLAQLLAGLAELPSEFALDSVEVQAVVSAEGQLGLVGSHVRGATEGAMKLVFKRRQQK